MESTSTSNGRPLASNVIALVIILVASVIRVILAIYFAEGLWTTVIELVVNAVLGIYFLKGYPWARAALITVAIINLVYFVVRGFVQEEVILALFETATSLCLLILLVGQASLGRAFFGMICYLLVILVFGGIALLTERVQPPPFDSVMDETMPVHQFHSKHRYTVSTDLPWRMLTPDQSVQVWGVQVPEADLRLVREDGSAYGLFFPLRFGSVHYTQEIGIELQEEIKDRWLNDLHGWTDYPMQDGFILTAEGEINQTPISYAVLYKHFGNFGLYAVFWSEAAHRERLIHESMVFYDNIQAPPLKERLPKRTPIEIFQSNRNAVVTVTVTDDEKKPVASGSGFNLSPDGLIVTNLHLLAQGTDIFIAFPAEPEQQQAKIVALSNVAADLVVLSIHGLDLPVVTDLGTVPLEVGDVVYLIGNPKQGVNTITDGVVENIAQERGHLFYQFSVPIDPVSSGAPLFNEYGEVAAIAEAIAAEEVISYGIAVEELETLFILPTPLTLKQFQDLLRNTSAQLHRAPAQLPAAYNGNNTKFNKLFVQQHAEE